VNHPAPKNAHRQQYGWAAGGPSFFSYVCSCCCYVITRSTRKVSKALKRLKEQSIGALVGAVSSFPSSFDLRTKALLSEESELLRRLLGLRDRRFVRIIFET
jgi:hypothetical protein